MERCIFFERDVGNLTSRSSNHPKRETGDEINIDIKGPSLAHDEANFKKKKRGKTVFFFVRKDIESSQATTHMNDEAKINKNKLY